MRTIRDVMQLFPSALESGLSADERTRSRSQFGTNQLTPLPRQPLWKKFLAKFDDPIIKILLAAALGLFFIGLAEQHASIEGLAVMIAIILATGVAFASEYKSDREFEVLNARKDALQVKVFRDGEFHTVPMEEVVVGDVVVLETGDEIPADGRLFKATDLLVDQSLMTGESTPVRKQVQSVEDSTDGPEQLGCLYRGTHVVDGVGQMLVTEVGDDTYLGQVARNLSGDDTESMGSDSAKRVRHKLTISKELTPLQLKLEKLASLISKVGYIAAVLIFLTLVVRGLFVGEIFWPHASADALKIGGNLLNYFVYMVIVIVVAVPEGLPMSVTISLALAMQKMTRANSLVRQLVACETIGSATVICSDKTGTMTQNRMQVVRLFSDGMTVDRVNSPGLGNPAPTQGVGAGFPSPLSEGSLKPIVTPFDWIALNAAVNSTAHLEHKQDKLIAVGNSTEGSLLHWLRESGLEYERLRLDVPAVYQIHFSSERKRMTTVIRLDGRLVVLAKGAPEWLLESSTHYLASDSTTKPWTLEAKQVVRTALHDAAEQTMRTLAFGHAALSAETSHDADDLHASRDSLEADLIFDGFVAIRDPLRDDVKDAVARCHAAGIEVKMITGDNVEIARAIAHEIGLIAQHDATVDGPDALVLTSSKFNELFDRFKALESLPKLTEVESKERNALASQIAGLRVLARARPLDKYKLVELLQERGQVVAVTGDGTNDAPALKKADVGLAMGIAGTEVAKEASKIVLLDDSFATIVKAVHWGRSLYENIQRFIQFQLTINISALVLTLLGPFLGVRPPFTVLQLLWINVIMDTLASIALCSEPPREGIMFLPPKRRDENIVTPAMTRTIFITAAFFVVAMLTLLLGMQHFDWFKAGNGDNLVDPEFSPLSQRQVTIFFTVYIFFQVWNQINCRSLVPEVSGLHGLLRNPAFLMIAGIVAVMQVLIVSIPFLGTVFRVEPLGLLDWLLIVTGTASVLVLGEITRRLRLAKKQSAATAA